MDKYEWSEVFMSIEGEAKYTGHPTAYIRFTRCNFQCRGFNNPDDLDTTSVEVLGFKPSEYKNIMTIPLITRGCDSIYSWDKKFSHMWNKGNAEQLAQEVINVLPNESPQYPNGNKIILSLTGGEPTLRLKQWLPLLKHPKLSGFNHYLIETNCSVPLKDDILKELYYWLFFEDKKITWSNSPKLSLSGEKWEDAIKPEIHMQQLQYGRASDYNVETYFKFVCEPTEQSFGEVDRAMKEYGIGHDVYIMPVACTEEQQQEISAKVAKMCIERGYIYCHRIQNSVFGNGVGT